VETAERACVEAARGEVVNVANINSPGQIVIAGHRAAVERAIAAAAALGSKKGVLLPVSAPFHSALMKPAADRLAGELEAVTVHAPRVPVVRNVDAGLTSTADDVKPFLVRQVASPVRWTDCLTVLAREGATTWLEVGPGRVLTGLLKRTVEGARGHAVEDPDSLEKAAAALAGGSKA
jgi:[acyl-carrier-protein] S-malonyltransferase